MNKIILFVILGIALTTSKILSSSKHYDYEVDPYEPEVDPIDGEEGEYGLTD